MVLEIDLYEDWVTYLFLILSTIGFVSTILISNTFYNHLTVFLLAALMARIYYSKSLKEPRPPFFLAVVAVFIGILAGSLVISKFWTNLIIFSLSFGVTYYLHMKNILVIFKNKNFLK